MKYVILLTSLWLASNAIFFYVCQSIAQVPKKNARVKPELIDVDLSEVSTLHIAVSTFLTI